MNVAKAGLVLRLLGRGKGAGGGGDPSRRARLAWAFKRRALSVPVFFKILGIGAIVALLFGSVTLIFARGSISRGLYRLLEENAIATARSLATDLERPMTTSDLMAIEGKLRRAVTTFPEIKYIVVRDAEENVLAHTFEGGVPPDLQRVYERSVEGRVQTLDAGDELVLDVVEPVLQGAVGSVQLGTSDVMIAKELSALTRSMLEVFALCLGLGSVCAVLLAQILTKPMQELVLATERIKSGDFSSRVRVESADELGTLADSFNRMADSLERYREEVEKKERARVALMDKILEAQEEERKRVSRELHDELGQSLLGLLLMARSLRKEGALDERSFEELQERIGSLLQQVKRMALGLRPPILDDYGLDVALSRLVEDIARHYGMKIDYQYSGPRDGSRLPPRVELALYRVAQEAISNVLRHSYAERASLVMLRRPSEVVMILEDDGRGFDVEKPNSTDGRRLGIEGMKERITLVGGSLTIESRPGSGTTVRASVPLSEEDQCR